MGREFIVRRPLPEFTLWDKMADSRAVFSFDLETTARCNLDCRHCYVNEPAGDRAMGIVSTPHFNHLIHRTRLISGLLLTWVVCRGAPYG